MIRAIRPSAMAQDDASFVTGWNVAPNLEYVLRLLPGPASCGVLLYDVDNALIATGAALAGTDQPCVLTPQAGQAVEMVDSDLGWHLLLTTTGTENQREIRIGPAVDLPDEIHPVYGADDLAVVRATAAIDAAAHYIDAVTVTCPFGLGAGIGDVVSALVDGAAVVGQVESITWTATPDGTTEQAVIRRHAAIAPAPAVVPPAPPAVSDDTGETDADTETSGNVLTNDEPGLTVVAVNGLSSNVGQPVAGSDGGVFTIASNGAWTFGPDEDFAALTGSDTATTSVTYHASDGTAEAVGTLTVTVSSGATQLWTPVEIATLLWLDTSDASTATIVDGKISQRADKSANGLHAAQAVAANRPVAGANKDVYDGIDDRLVIPNTAMLNTPAYIAVVCKPSITSQYHGFIDKRGNSSGWMLDSGPTATAGRPRITATTTVLVAPTNVQNTLAIIEAQIAGTSTFVGTPTGVTTGTLPTPSTNTENITIGGTGARTASLNMDFHEAVILPAAPSTALRQMIQGYLAHKWDGLLGVTTLVDSLPANHPYKSAAPTL